MDVHIISREIIKPSSSTPKHLRTYKLSGLDQKNINAHIPICFFYSAAPKSCDYLKKSLSEILTHYYPLAGRVKDFLSIDCDDSGVSFIEAHVVGGNISDVLKQREIDPQEQLLPCKLEEMITARSILAIQVSYFDCGGMAICFLFRHVVVDATSAANFIKKWAATATCGGDDITVKDVILDYTSIFPPINQSAIPETTNSHTPSEGTVYRRFVFEGFKISSLQEKIGNQPTRFEALFALMVGALTAVKSEEDELIATILVNLRRRMNPPISEQCLGNMFAIIIANWPLEETASYSDLTAKVHELLGMVNGEYMKKASPNGWLLHPVRKHAIKKREKFFIISSWCALPWYETDFGWGKPKAVVPVGRYNLADGNILTVLIDTSDGKGIEARMLMSKEEMAKFEQDSGVMAYASF